MKISRRKALGAIGAVAAVPAVGATGAQLPEWKPTNWIYADTGEVSHWDIGRAERTSVLGERETRDLISPVQRNVYRDAVHAQDAEVTRTEFYPGCTDDDEKLRQALAEPMSEAETRRRREWMQAHYPDFVFSDEAKG